MSDIIGFYLHAGTTQERDLLENIWQWDNHRLERSHTYIQWIFPLDEPSRAQPRSPILTPQDIDLLKSNEHFQKKFLLSLQVMLRFYGMQIVSDPSRNPIIEKSEGFLQQKKNWMVYGDHNHLRLTRVMKSLKLLGQPEYANALKNCLLSLAAEEPAVFSGTTLSFWKEI